VKGANEFPFVFDLRYLPALLCRTQVNEFCELLLRVASHLSQTFNSLTKQFPFIHISSFPEEIVVSLTFRFHSLLLRTTGQNLFGTL